MYDNFVIINFDYTSVFYKRFMTFKNILLLNKRKIETYGYCYKKKRMRQKANEREETKSFLRLLCTLPYQFNVVCVCVRLLYCHFRVDTILNGNKSCFCMGFRLGSLIKRYHLSELLCSQSD